jgi:hypothetical protein
MYKYPVTAESGLEISSINPIITLPQIDFPEIKIDINWSAIEIDFDKLIAEQIDQNWKEPEPPRQDMSMGKLGNPDTFFVRQFRWTMESPSSDRWNDDSLDSHYAKNVEFDFLDQILKMEAMEMILAGQGMRLHSWLRSVKNPKNERELIFKTYDGCGNVVYQYTIKGLLLIGDSASFDYNSSEVASRKIILQYRELEEKFLLKRK